MPELPEVQALVDFLGARTSGLAVTGIELGSVSVLKTFNPPPEALTGSVVEGARRHGKWIDLNCGGTHLVFHLSRAGWLRFSDELSQTRLRPGKSPIAMRVRLEDGSGFDLTEAGTKKRLAAYLVASAQEVPAIASLGPDPLAESFSLAEFAQILQSRRAQLKGVLRDQSIIAGVGKRDFADHIAALWAGLSGPAMHPHPRSLRVLELFSRTTRCHGHGREQALAQRGIQPLHLGIIET